MKQGFFLTRQISEYDRRSMPAQDNVAKVLYVFDKYGATLAIISPRRLV